MVSEGVGRSADEDVPAREGQIVNRISGLRSRQRREGLVKLAERPTLAMGQSCCSSRSRPHHHDLPRFAVSLDATRIMTASCHAI